MQSNEWTKSEIKHKWDTIVLTNTRDTYSLIIKVLHEAVSAGVPLTHHEAAVKFARLLQPTNQAYIPILQDAMRDPSATLDSIWPTVTKTVFFLRLSGAPSHAHSANVQRPARTPFRRDPCNWCGAPGHDESQCYSKDPANLLLHPPRQGWPDGVVLERFRLKYCIPRNTIANQTPTRTTAHQGASTSTPSQDPFP